MCNKNVRQNQTDMCIKLYPLVTHYYPAEMPEAVSHAALAICWSLSHVQNLLVQCAHADRRQRDGALQKII